MPNEVNLQLRYAFESHASLEDRAVIRAGLESFNSAILGPEHNYPLTLLVRDLGDRVVAGLLGDLYYNWLYIAALWVEEPLRGCGVGRRLMMMAEVEAARHLRTHAHVDTFDFQALGFYQKLGYTLFGELGPYGNGHMRYYLKKALPGLPTAELASNLPPAGNQS